MCGIAMSPEREVELREYMEEREEKKRRRAQRLSFREVLIHIGGAGNLITEAGMRLIEENTLYYLWKYPGHCWCTGCGADLGDLRLKHGTRMICPVCRREATFRHEARGHRKLFDEFVLYEWRRSVIDGEAIVLTAVSVWHDQRYDRPERNPAQHKCSAIYLFQPGKPVTCYKNHYWYEDRDELENYVRHDDICPEHTIGGKTRRVVMDGMAFRAALEGTAIGRVYQLIRSEGDSDAATIKKIANAAARPYIEYLYKCGQPELARHLGAMARVSRAVVPRPRAKSIRELLGLTEGQWYEARRDHLRITEETLRRLRCLERMGMGDMKLREVARLEKPAYYMERIAPPNFKGQVPDRSIRGLTEGAPEKLRRKIYRYLMKNVEHNRLTDWEDYYSALRELGEDMTDSALMLPRDFKTMHDRMCERLKMKINREKAEAMRMLEAEFREKQLPRLRELYNFDACGLSLRPYECAEDIMNEGTRLKICIGNYTERYLKGNVIICSLRRADEPDEPWRAVEFELRNPGEVRQDRGYHNRVAMDEPPGDRRQIGRFWQAYRRHLKTSEKRRRNGA